MIIKLQVKESFLLPSYVGNYVMRRRIFLELRAVSLLYFFQSPKLVFAFDFVCE